MRPIHASLIALSLSGCSFVQGALPVARQAAVPVAAGVETRVAANCIRATEGGQPPSAVQTLRIQNARDVFDATIALQLAQTALDALARVRARTDAVCPPLPTVPPAEPVAP